MEMTQEWINQFNEKCGKFRGYFKKPDQLPHVWWKFTGISYQPVFEDHEMKYHSDWNWIMEVVEVIEIKFPKYILQWEYDDREEFAENGKYKAYWFTLYHKDEICSGLSDLRSKSRKQAVIQAIDQFIDWYNKQKEL